MKNEYIIEIASRLESAKTRLKELHWSSPGLNIHNITDNVSDWINETEDALIENLMAVSNDFVYPGDLKNIPWESKELENFLIDLRGFFTSIKRKLGDDLIYSGVINIIDDAIQKNNMYIYQTRIAKHKS